MSNFAHAVPIQAYAVNVDDNKGGTNNPPATAPQMDETIGLSYAERNNILKNHYDFPPGVNEQFNIACDLLGPRYWIVDNSGSMSNNDGHVLIKSSAGVEGMVPCSRWQELGTSINWHATLAARLRVPTEFRLLNNPGRAAQVIHVGHGNEQAEINMVNQSMETGPTGRTPLCAQLHQIYQQIAVQAENLRSQGRKALVVIASDGEASDGNVATALR